MSKIYIQTDNKTIKELIKKWRLDNLDISEEFIKLIMSAANAEI